MTQLLLFDFPTTTATAAAPSITSPVPRVGREEAPSRAATPRFTTPAPSTRRERQVRTAAERREGAAEASPAKPLCSGSLPLYDPAQGELHRIGDLAQLVLARYEIVHRRRAARLRRAQASPSLT